VVAVTDYDEVPRALNPGERKVLSQYLAGSGRADSKILIAQIPHITVVKTHISTLDLSVDATQAEPAYVEAPGPLQPRMFAIGPDSEIWAEVLVWVTGGFLSGMGLAWWNDDVPRSWDRVGATAYDWELPPES
jgi:hypothetical protein